MENTKYELFRSELKKTAKQLFGEFIKTHNREEICGFALYSDDSAMSISAALNTYKHLDESRKEEPGYDSYFRFSPNEWEYDFLESKEMDDLSDFLKQGLFQTPKKQFIEHRYKIYNIIVDILKDLKEENLFCELKDDFVLIFAITDFFDLELEVAAIKKLNSDDIAQEFEVWKKEEAEEDDDDGEDDDYDFEDDDE
jgi:hypothetical protein